MTDPTRFLTPATDQRVAITSVDPQNYRATAITRQRTLIVIDTRYHVGAIHVTPAVGDQWIVHRYGDNWVLDSQLPANTTELLAVADNPVPGMTQIGSTNPSGRGPLELNGSEINVRGPASVDGTLTLGNTILRGGDTGLETSGPELMIEGPLEQSLDGGTTWATVGTTSGGDTTKVDANPPITGATHTKITYDSKGLVTDGTDITIPDVGGLGPVLDNKSPLVHIHTEGDVTSLITDLAHKSDIDHTHSADGVALDPDLVDIAALSPANLDFIQRVSGHWTNVPPSAVKGGLSLLFSDIAGLIDNLQIPLLDATKVTTGTFLETLIPTLTAGKIPSLNASKITAGTLLETLIPALTLPKIPSLPASQINPALGTFVTSLIPTLTTGHIPLLPTSKIDPASGQFAQSMLNITSIATSLLTGTIADPQIPNLNASKITAGVLNLLRLPPLPTSQITTGTFPQTMLDITNIASSIVSGSFLASQIPLLDVTKIFGGPFDIGMIPSLPAGKVTTGQFPQSMIANLDSALAAGGQILTDAIVNALGIPGTGHTPVEANTALQNIPGLNIVSQIAASIIPLIDATKIFGGPFDVGMIPSLNASKITAGTLLDTLIPNLNASKITAGTFLDTMIPALNASKITAGTFPQSMLNITNIAGSIISGVLNAAQVPKTLDTSWISSGTWANSFIPKTLDTSWISSGTWGTSFIPKALDTSWITSGTWGTSFIPKTLDTSWISSGTWGNSFIPKTLDTSWITGGTWADSFVPGLVQTRDAIYQAIFGGTTVNTTPAQTKSALQNIPGTNIISTLLSSVIPKSLDTSWITSGTWSNSFIPKTLDTSWIPSGNLPQTRIDNLTTNLGSIFTTITSPTRPELLQNVPLGSIGQFNPELLTNPNYDSLGSVSGGSTTWTWDPAVSHTGTTGSARATGNGTSQQLLSDPPIPVSPNQVLTISHWLQWSGVTAGAGMAFKLGVAAYLGVGISNNVDLQLVNTPAATGAWQQLSGQYTVPASGVDNIRLQLTVSSAVTAGNIWWDDGSVKKTQLLSQNWTTALVGDLSNHLTAINARTLITDTTALMSTLGLGDSSLTAITSRLANLGSGGKFDATQLLNLIPLPNIPTLTVPKIPALDATQITTGFFPQGQVNGLSTALQNGLNVTQTLQDTIFQTFSQTSLTNTALTDLVRSLNAIPFGSILGVGGPANLGSSVTSTWDNLISGLVGAVGTGAGLSDLFNIGQQVSSNAAKGGNSWDILGIRNNKSLDSGLLSTSQSNIGLSKIGLGASAPTFNVTSASFPMAFHRIDEAGTKGVVSWLGSGNANITDFRVNIWKMDIVSGNMTLVHGSLNANGALASTMNYCIYTLPTPLSVVAGEVYGIELALVGTGTHAVAGQSAWLPNHPSVNPKNLAALRTAGGASPALNTVITAANIGYPTTTANPAASVNVPFVEFGVNQGGTVAPHGPVTTYYGTVGSSTVPIPDWANYVDVIAVGAGGGGGGGGAFGVAQHNGGGAGQWVTGTAVRGTDFSSGVVVSTTIGAGGTFGTSFVNSQTPGGNTVVSIPSSTLTATGGVVNYGQDNGQGAGNVSYNGITYAGGAQQGTSGAVGAAPGGGGASGPDISGGPGGPGANGGAWIVFRQT